VNSERLRQIEHLYHKASELEEDQRDLYLRKACLGDDHLRKEIDSLLVHEKESESFLESTALLQEIPSLAGSWTGTPEPEIGAFIGRYQILEQLGDFV